MKNSVILNYFNKSYDSFLRILKSSFIYNILTRFVSFVGNSMLNSYIVSKLLRYREDIEDKSLITKILNLLSKVIYGIFDFIRSIFKKSVVESRLIDFSKNAYNNILGSIVSFICITCGTTLITFGILKVVTGSLTINKAIIYIIISVILYIIAFSNVKLKDMMSNSSFVKIINRLLSEKSNEEC
ncbi:hypothetical protein CLPU_4c02220 [Gottschalkia purinilytica]|uniref:Uncharacterized protein n=1 Tax=Gottschalkia purinilytica TaxID=1503 RepID=A0A0L0WCI8_GOTPU|nr:hypothetical protein [Gottschalkia purinilytica]KNF09176.1 hypothetical protein CLPU_4c02220 [Gottschalkia purinilytica]